MKLKTVLSIMLIGMISLTAFATTSKLEQKQKTEFKMESTFQIEALSVVNDFEFAFVLTRARFLNNSKVEVFTSSIKPEVVLNDMIGKIEKQSYQFYSIPNIRSNC